ncbi:hypothetical protein AB9P05_20350 [Roseivirga sp. BDSF3-8]|uniref:hypothetical protein n=1 Tax=Roseivirga sp. BDSF3-8 TaxID=3241598 RepID=UPI0035324047
MEQPLFIAKKESEQKTLDFEYLRSQGIKYIQELTGAFWTDFNEHDPGVTILEQLCYSLTDLAYRTEFDVKDHLFNSKSSDQAFLKPNQILPCNALTVNDYRKLVFDSVFEIKNVWLEPVSSEQHSLNGLYKIFLDVDSNLRDEDFIEGIKQKTQEVFVANRNLGEDIEEIVVLEHLPVSVNAEVETDGTEDLEHTLAKIFFRIEEYLCPEIRFYSLEELREEGYSLNDIFNGPLLKHGFIKNEELHPKPNRILISEIIKIIMQVEGIVSVKNLYLQVDGKIYNNQVDLPAHHLPHLVTEVNSGEYSIKFFKGSVSYGSLEEKNVRRKLNELKSATRRVYRLNEEAIELSKGENLGIEEYYSIQNHFPLNYGIGSYGVPDEPTRQRVAQARQLKAYLMIYEQLLANYLSQLSHVKDLFSIRDVSDNTYFYQALKAVPNAEPLFKNEADKKLDDPLLDGANIPLSYEKGLPELIKEKDNYKERRNRFLDYLLAIHGESYQQYALSQYNYYFDEDDFERHLIQNKTRLLHSLPYINRNRAKAFDYLSESVNTTNIAGLEAKVSILLGLGVAPGDADEDQTYRAHSLISAITRHGIELQAKDAKRTQLRKWIRSSNVPDNITTDLIESTFDFVDAEDVSVAMDDKERHELLKETLPFRSNQLTADFLQEGIDLFGYRVGKVPDSEEFMVVYYQGGEEPWLQIGRFESEEKAATAVIELVDFLKRVNIESEGAHLVEHILLRPSVEDRKFGIYLRNENGDLFLKSRKQYSFEERKKTINVLREHLNRYENYSVEITSTNDFEVQFNTPDEFIRFVSIEAYESVEETHARMERLYRYLSNKDEVRSYNDKIGYYLQNSEEQGEIPEEFFSYRISMIFPDWTARFADPEFRSLAEDVISQQQPANIGAQCYWVGAESMKEFETVYYSWMEEMRKDQPAKEELDKLQTLMTGLLLTFKSGSNA